MGKFTLVLAPKAAKDLDGLSDSTCEKIVKSLRVLEENPFPRGKLVRKLKGKGSDFYRLRADKYRVFYEVSGTKVIILRVISKKDAEKFIRQIG